MNIRASRLLGLLFCLFILVVASGCQARKASEEVPVAATEAREPAPMKESASGTDQAKPKRAVAHEIQVTMRAGSPGEVASQLVALAEAQGGYVVSSSTRAAAPGTVGAELSLRVPAAKIESILTQLRKLGEVRSEVRKGDDVTSEVVDTEARLTARRAFEKRLLELLSSARSVDDMLKVEAELTRVRTEIEQLVGQARTLAQRTDFALLTVNVESPEASRAAVEPFAARLGDAFRSALSTSQSVILGFVQFLGVILPLMALGALVWLPIRFLRRRAKQRRAARALEQMAQGSK